MDDCPTLDGASRGRHIGRREALQRIGLACGAAMTVNFGAGCAFAGSMRARSELSTSSPEARRHPAAAQGITSLTNRSVPYSVSDQHLVEMRQGPIRAVIVDNAALDEAPLPGHRAGYHGLASLTHERRAENLFVPTVGGLNFEFIHDGTPKDIDVLFEPRRSPMELRVVDDRTVELYQPPTPNWKLESCGRYQLLSDGSIEYTFECIPRERTFENGYIGLFWANYIHRPDDRAIYFIGRSLRSREERWIRAVSPEHGVESTHPPDGPLPDLSFDPEFSLRLVSSRSDYVYTSAWYYGVSHDMAYALMFREGDRLWFAQSPNGGGETNPAWDFQWFIPDYQIDEPYGFTMRVAYLPFENRAQVEAATRRSRAALANS